MLISRVQLLTVINHVLQVACKHVEYDTLLVFLHLAQMRLTQLLRKLAFDLVITQMIDQYHSLSRHQVYFKSDVLRPSLRLPRGV